MAHYINNKKFLEEISLYREKVIESKEQGTKKPRLPNYIGECFLQIAERLSRKPNFINYPFRDEMKSDGIENCVLYVDNFDPAKSSNPFAYFTQIIHYAFLRRIQKEKKQLYIKHKSTEHMYLNSELVDYNEFDENVSASFIDIENEKKHEFIADFEKKLNEKKKKITGLEKFVGDENE